MQKIEKRAMARSTRTDLGEPSSPEIAPPLEADARSRAERALGFPLPALLAALYAKIGNGGYGPGYGLLGVAGGATDDRGYDAVELYALYRQPDPDDPSWAWPEGLPPLCHWGCAIYGCVDCTREPHPRSSFSTLARTTATGRGASSRTGTASRAGSPPGPTASIFGRNSTVAATRPDRATGRRGER